MAGAELAVIIVVAICVKLVAIWIVWHYTKKRRAANQRLAQLMIAQQNRGYQTSEPTFEQKY